MNISAGYGGTLLFTSQTSGSGTLFNLDSDTAVNMQAGSNITIDQNVSVEWSSTQNQWTLTAPTVQLNSGAQLGIVAGAFSAAGYSHQQLDPRKWFQ